MNCIIVDDEPLAIDILESFAEKIPFLQTVGTYTNAFEALELVHNNKIDLIFLDIQMPNLTGIDFVKSLKNPPQIIFTTAYSNYAVDGFNLDATDYLVKPIPFDRFLKAVNKANELFELKQQGIKQSKPSFPTNSLHDQYIMVKADYKLVRIDLNKILYIEGLKDYLKIFLEDQKPILTLSSFKKLETKLPADLFHRVHRSYMVSLQKIESIQKHRIKIGTELIPIGDSCKNDFYNKIGSET